MNMTMGFNQWYLPFCRYEINNINSALYKETKKKFNWIWGEILRGGKLMAGKFRTNFEIARRGALRKEECESNQWITARPLIQYPLL